LGDCVKIGKHVFHLFNLILPFTIYFFFFFFFFFYSLGPAETRVEARSHFTGTC